MTQNGKDVVNDRDAPKGQEDWYGQFGDCVFAAFQTLAMRRWVRGRRTSEEVAGLDRPANLTRGIVSASVDQIERGDLRGFKEVFATQAVELDEIFTQYARMAAANSYDFETFMRIALKAQWQCRWTLKTLLATNDLRLPRARIARPASRRRAKGRKKIFKQTIENGKTSA